MTDTHRVARAWNAILVIVAIMTAGSLIMLFVLTPKVINGASISNEIVRGNTIAACREEAHLAVDRAAINLRVAQSEQIAFIPDAVVGALSNDENIMRQGDSINQAVKTALVSYEEANKEYDRITQADEETILKECQID